MQFFSLQDWGFSTSEDIWDDSWQPSGPVNGTKVEFQKPEELGSQEKNTGATGIQKVNI